MTTPEIINTGDLPNDGSGDPLRLAFDKINNNFANLFAITAVEGELIPVEELIDDQISGNGFSGNINIGLVANNVYYTLPDSATPVQVAQFDTFAYVANLITPTGPYGAQEYINIGAQANDGEGDPLRTAFAKINNNFSNLFFTTTSTSNTFTVGLDTNQVIYETSANTFSQAKFQIRSSDPGTDDMQDITITASITNNLAGVRFTGYGTLFEGNALCRYDMDVSDGNVRLLINPIKNAVILHFIASEVTFIGTSPPGVDIALDGYSANSLMGTENGLILTTES
jgi:hypothetical protein